MCFRALELFLFLIYLSVTRLGNFFKVLATLKNRPSLWWIFGQFWKPAVANLEKLGDFLLSNIWSRWPSSCTKDLLDFVRPISDTFRNRFVRFRSCSAARVRAKAEIVAAILAFYYQQKFGSGLNYFDECEWRKEKAVCRESERDEVWKHNKTFQKKKRRFKETEKDNATGCERERERKKEMKYGSILRQLRTRKGVCRERERWSKHKKAFKKQKTRNGDDTWNQRRKFKLIYLTKRVPNG